jgi:quercetin dioxygenase-like cupin family protein
MKFMSSKKLTLRPLLFLSAAFLSGMIADNAVEAAKGKLRVTTLLKQDLPDIKGKMLQVVELNLEPGAGSPPHSHPGHVAGYVIEGSFEVQLDDDESKIFRPGEVFYEPDGAIHTVGRNPSDTEPTKVVVFMLMDESRPSTILHTH